MHTYRVLVQTAILAVTILGGMGILVTNNFGNKIALEVLKVSPVNTVVSPLALKLPLCRLAAFARGDSKTELMSALGMTQEKQLNCYEPLHTELFLSQMSELTMHNRIYLNDSLQANPEFLNSSMADNGVRVGKTGFRYPKAAAKYMNRWAASETFYRVSTLIDDDDIDNTTSMVILNGLYYKGNWETPFDVRYTTMRHFRDETNKAEYIPMMTSMSNYDSVDEVNDNVKALRLNFFSMGLSITFVIPEKRDALPDLLEKLYKEPDYIGNLRKKLTSNYLKILIPRIKIKTYVDWTDFLRLIGINKILNANNRDLDGILKNGTTSEVPVHLSKAKQKVFLDIDEMGISRHLPKFGADVERAAQEMARYGDTAEELALDHPFYFVVSLRTSGVDHDLFNGVYRRPEPI